MCFLGGVFGEGGIVEMKFELRSCLGRRDGKRCLCFCYGWSMMAFVLRLKGVDRMKSVSPHEQRS